ncbi:hypothetical protein Herbaro_17295 [Herbaspirillum sp. WKF16]|jgi:hypothetical protein|uniref:hypothetical protein n=1 Tax=Herbaspirillum sp. WKF16 TaxID=3028312 RepID=UPI0023A9B6D7|nr:hypothetical protein [Herbaspirillum sp. WKF16]WDZ95227.1 hypothetical protein Herbaro_17295 [Herbaspirillum sp. WKF16]
MSFRPNKTFTEEEIERAVETHRNKHKKDDGDDGRLDPGHADEKTAMAREAKPLWPRRKIHHKREEKYDGEDS